MRNLKKLLAVIVAVCVLATFTVPAFAETKTADAVCKDLGMIKGSGAGVTADYLKTQPDRLQGAILLLRLKGLEDTAKAFLGTDNYADAAGLNDTNQSILAYLKATPEVGYKGIGDNKFDPLSKMTAKQYYKLLLIALGYEEDKDFTWATVFSTAAKAGLTALVDNDSFTIADLCTGTVEALKAKVKDGSDTLIGKLVDSGAIASAAAVTAGIYTATAKAVEITSATADNLKAAKFVFNQELDSKTVKVGNVSVNDSKKIDANRGVTLLDDKKTVLVAIDTETLVDQNKELEFTFKNFKAATGTAMAETKKKVTFIDNTIPTITGALAKNPKTLVINASEPMKYDNTYSKTLSEIKIDGAAKIAKSTVSFAKNTITVIFADAMLTGTHKVEISGIKDYAGFVALPQTFNIDVAEDKTAPAIVSAVMNSNTEIEVTFSEELDAAGSFTVDGTDVASGDVTVNPSDRTKVTLKLSKALGIGATVEIKISYKDQTDVMGNKVSSSTVFTFKVADDTALPTVTAAIGTDNKITLTFSKSMITNEGSIKILNADDSDKQLKKLTIGTAPATFKTDTNNTVIELAKADSGIDNKGATNLKIVIEKMKDATVRTNAMPDTTLTLKSYDAQKPSVIKYYKTTDTDYVTIYFSEAMNEDSIKNLSNYNLQPNGAAISGGAFSVLSGAKVDSVASDAKSVKFKVANIGKDAIKATALIEVQAVKDVNGNMIDTTTVAGVIPVPSIDTATIKATAQNEVKVSFTQQVSTIDTDLFYVVTTGGSSEVVKTTFKSVSLSSDMKTATFKTTSDMGTTVASLQLKVNHKEACKDVFGNELSATNGTYYSMIDQIKPEVKKIDKGSTPGSIYVNFTEAVRLTGGALDADLILKDKDGNEVTLVPANVKFFAKTDSTAEFAILSNVGTQLFERIVFEGLSSGQNYTVEFIGKTIRDISENKLAAKDATTVTTENN